MFWYVLTKLTYTIGKFKPYFGKFGNDPWIFIIHNIFHEGVKIAYSLLLALRYQISLISVLTADENKILMVYQLL